MSARQGASVLIARYSTGLPSLRTQALEAPLVDEGLLSAVRSQQYQSSHGKARHCYRIYSDPAHEPEMAGL